MWITGIHELESSSTRFPSTFAGTGFEVEQPGLSSAALSYGTAGWPP